MKAERRNPISRLEAFSDAVFAFALTLLVVSLEVPHGYHDLMVLLRGFLPFGCSFALLVWIWYEHSTVFSKYPVLDQMAVVLNAALLFVVLFYVYPLKYVFTQMFAFMVPDAKGEPLTPDQLGRIFAIYGLGYTAVFTLFALLYHHAWRKRAALGLSGLEAYDARTEMGHQVVSATVGVIAAAWAILAPRRYGLVSISGFLYMFMGPAHGAYSRWAGKRRRVFVTKHEAAAQP
jgi:uncharacterized membrane protein